MSLQLGVLAMEQALSAPRAMLAAIQAVGKFRHHHPHYPELILNHVQHWNIRPLRFTRTTHSLASNMEISTGGIAAHMAGQRNRAIILTRRSFGVTECITNGILDQILAR